VSPTERVILVISMKKADGMRLETKNRLF